MKAKPKNKQHDARAASFKRIAKALRAESKSSCCPVLNARQIARAFDAEAAQLRGMR